MTRYSKWLLFTLILLGYCCSAQDEKRAHARDSLIAIAILNLDSNMVYVEGGTFKMGLPENSDVEGGEVEKPQHTVNVNSFYMLKTPVTQALWLSVMDSNTSVHKNCYTCPMENISFNDVQQFIKLLNKMTGKHYRLPTEAEFEYAASEGKKSHGYKYSGSNTIDEVGWYGSNAGMHSHPVAQKKPNELGLYDMSGNIWEWCSDWFDDHYYKYSPADNPTGPPHGLKKTLRGGTWISLDEGCLVIARAGAEPWSKDKYVGFRLVREP